ncbi:3-phosphoshikimate 1-carboxyvinyltransferase [Lachnospiraceae bacterium 3-1]|nr:3-phosphoshikimate 1-carboxyvinyltransferase [Lachnospiraceae bacterium 3-1]
MELEAKHSFHGELSVPGDKSISHRGIMFGAISNGLTEVSNFLQGADCLSTISCFRQLGISIENDGCKVLVHGKGLHGLTAPSQILNVGNSGTTLRLISGILAGQPFQSTLDGDASIRKRPMKRIFTPLSEMGAWFQCWDSSHFPKQQQKTNSDCAPFTIQGGNTKHIHYHSPIASAQVKSAVLLAGLYGDGITKVTEPVLSRNHTELMLAGFGADILSTDTTAAIRPEPKLEGQSIHVPGDISSAAYFIALGLIHPHAEILIQNTGINPTRSGILQAAIAMGGKLTLLNQRTVSGEPVADILVSSSNLHGTVIEGNMIPTLIDELPILAVMAAFAEGTTIIKDAQELKVKESDRIATVTENLKAMGGDITPTPDGMVIKGHTPLHGAQIKTYGDHRIAMSFAIAGLNAQGKTTFDEEGCVTVSYPSFYEDIERLAR